MHHIKFVVNGMERELLVNAQELLSDMLRDRLGLKGTKVACGAGECGACTVLLDEKPVNACLVLAVQADGKSILTIEGMADGPELHPIQKAFIEQGAIQCGFCTPGLIMTTKAMLEENPEPTEEEVRDGLIGHICRCTGYQKIVSAVVSAGQEIQAQRREN